MDIQNVVVDNKHLLSIFAGSDYNQPYRFQPYVKIVVPFEEYRIFVRDVLSSSLRGIFNADMYQRALDYMDDTKLVKLYYRDLSEAIIDELKWACRRNKEATQIQHQFVDGIGITTDTFEQACDFLTAEVVKIAGDDLSKSISPYLSSFSSHNRRLFSYAVVLRSMCYMGEIKKL